MENGSTGSPLPWLMKMGQGAGPGDRSRSVQASSLTIEPDRITRPPTASGAASATSVDSIAPCENPPSTTARAGKPVRRAISPSSAVTCARAAGSPAGVSRRSSPASGP